MSEEKIEATQESEGGQKEVQMEEMLSVLYGGVRQGVGGVISGVGKFASYSWLGVKYAGGDLKGLSIKLAERVK
jgi:hypothetical protein